MVFTSRLENAGLQTESGTGGIMLDVLIVRVY
jgi:hypothetical protein